MKSVYLRIYDIVLTVFTVIAALCLMGACLEISKAGRLTCVDSHILILMETANL